MTSTHRILTALAGLAFLTVLGTVGYGEVRPLSVPGQLFTVFLIVTGVGSALYLLSAVAETLVEGRLRDIYQRSTMQRRIDAGDHLIVIGERSELETLARRAQSPSAAP